MKPLRINADYENELFFKKTSSPLINQSLEFLSFFLNEEAIYSTKTYQESYLEYVSAISGQSPKIIAQGPYINWWGALQNLSVEQWWNSKMTSAKLNIDKGWDPEIIIIDNEADLHKLKKDSSYLLKDPFEMSGRKFIVLQADQSAPKLSPATYLAEPLLDRKFDFSTYIYPDGRIIHYENLVDKRFQYKGSIFSNLGHATIDNLSFFRMLPEKSWIIFQDQLAAVIQYYQKYPNQIGYSIDSFIYEENGELKIRALSEVNYRRTMGRVAYELANKYFSHMAWAGLFIIPTTDTPLWKKLGRIEENCLILSPGDTRFEVLLVAAVDNLEGYKLVAKVTGLVP
jgi:hypothetical protein